MLLTIATGRPGMTAVSCPAGVIASSVSPSSETCSTPGGTSTIPVSPRAGGGAGFQPPRPAAPADAIEEIRGRPELRLDRAARQQIARHRQRADPGAVAGVRLAALDLVFGVEMARVQIERERAPAAVRRQADDDALLRIAARRHVAEAPHGLH